MKTKDRLTAKQEAFIEKVDWALQNQAEGVETLNNYSALLALWLNERPEHPTPLERELFIRFISPEEVYFLVDEEEGQGVPVAQFALIPSELVVAAGYDLESFYSFLGI